MKTIIAILVIGTLIVLGFNFYRSHEIPPQDTEVVSVSEDQEVKDVVIAFGAHLKNVSLTAESSIAAETIRTEYAPYVTESLLSAWVQNPATAPGRLTSSPWPERIEIASVIKKEGNSYEVSGAIISMTSVEVEQGGNAGFEPIMMTLVKEGDTWRIASLVGEPS